MLNGGKKKLVIKPFKVQPKLPDNFEASTWMKLTDAIYAVDNNEIINSNKEELYQTVEDLCLHKSGPVIYEKLSAVCSEIIEKRVNALVSYKNLDNWKFLESILKVWHHNCEVMRTIRNIFLYLDRTYVLQSSGVLPIWDLGLLYFKQCLARLCDVESKVFTSVLLAIEVDRQLSATRFGDENNSAGADRSTDSLQLNYDVLAGVCSMMQSLRIYEMKFEPCLLEDSKRFFISEKEKLIVNLSPAQYLMHAEGRLREVNTMIIKYLRSESSRRSLLSIIEGVLLDPVSMVHVIDNGFPSFLSQHELSNIKLLYKLTVRINNSDTLEALRSRWALYIKNTGESLFRETAQEGDRAKDPVNEVLQLQDKLNDILQACFQSNNNFRAALKSSFEHFVNVNYMIDVTPTAGKVSQLLARFIDKKLRGEKGLSDSDLVCTLDKCMQLFYYINGKDMFEGHYRKYLARRLLLEKSSDYELEKNMISKLKAECGSNFTSKLEGMLADMTHAKEIQFHYNNTIGVNGAKSGGLDAQVQVLTSGFWPTPPVLFTNNTPVDTFPQGLKQAQNAFDAFYREKYQGRRLAWSYSSDRCLVTARFPKGKKELEVSFHQALILLLFNEGPDTVKYSLEHVRNAVPLEDGELKRTLLSLCNGPIGTRVLVKEPKSKDVNPGDMFGYNAEFTNKLFHIKINQIQLRETQEDTDKINDEVYRDRLYTCDAVIVRVMKARKTLSHNVLIAELLSQLKFPIKVADIKKRIESLIERDYLERDSHDNAVYNYLA